MLVRSRNAVAFAFPTVAIDALNCVVSLSSGSWVVGLDTSTYRHHAKLLLLIYCLPWLSRCKEVIGLRVRLSAIWGEVRSQHSTWKVLRNLDLNVAEIPFSSSALALLLIWVVGLGCSRR